MKFILLKSIIIIAGLTTNLMDYKHLCAYECMCIQAMYVLHLKLRDSSTDSAKNSAELIAVESWSLKG